MNKKIKIFFIFIIFTIIFTNKSLAIPVAPFKKFFQEIIEIFSSKTKDVMKQGNKTDDSITAGVGKSIDDTNLAFKDQDLIISKIGNDAHSTHFNDAINQSSSSLSLKHGVRIRKSGKKILNESDNLIDLYDFGFRDTEENIKVSKYILKSWIGKIYRTSELTRSI